MNSQTFILIFLVALPIGFMLILLLRPAIHWYTGMKKHLENQEKIIKLLEKKSNE